MRCYDSLGRRTIEAVRQLGSTFALSSWDYNDTPCSGGSCSAAITHHQAVSATETRTTVLRLDGLGRVVETQTDGPQGKAILKAVELDGLGRVVSETIPSFDQLAADATQYQYDALDRIVSTTRPGAGRVWTSVFGPDFKTDIDPTGIQRKTLSNGFGEVLQVQSPL